MLTLERGVRERRREISCLSQRRLKILGLADELKSLVRIGIKLSSFVLSFGKLNLHSGGEIGFMSR